MSIEAKPLPEHSKGLVLAFRSFEAYVRVLEIVTQPHDYNSPPWDPICISDFFRPRQHDRRMDNLIQPQLRTDKPILSEGYYPNFGLTTAEASPIKISLYSLVRNLHHGFGIPKDIVIDLAKEEQYRKLMNEAFEEARVHCPGDFWTRCGIVFSKNFQGGTIFVSHPIIPGVTPNWNIQSSLERRKEQNPERAAGGLERIDRGYIHSEFQAARLDHTLVLTEDYFIDLGKPKLGRRRRLWVNFQKRT